MPRNLVLILFLCLSGTAHCRAADGTHGDVDKDGTYDWEDFEKRDW